MSEWVFFMHPPRDDFTATMTDAERSAFAAHAAWLCRLRGRDHQPGAGMKVGMVALHYPRREHWDEMISRVRRAADVMATVPGCLAVDCWVTEDGQAVVTTGQWESGQALAAGFAAVQAAGVDFSYDERESRPREVFKLISG